MHGSSKWSKLRILYVTMFAFPPPTFPAACTAHLILTELMLMSMSSDYVKFLSQSYVKIKCII